MFTTLFLSASASFFELKVLFAFDRLRWSHRFLSYAMDYLELIFLLSFLTSLLQTLDFSESMQSPHIEHLLSVPCIPA
jgi:hypothetical protein